MVRRRAYGMIKKAFEDNGINFGLPTVQVRDVEHGVAAAAATLAGPDRAGA